MPRKNIKDYTQMQIKKSVLKELSKLKVHPNQSYSEVIDSLIKKLGEKQ
jgi:predicted CopG family antitoxin